MTSHRNRYVKVSLAERCPTSLVGGTVESQHDDHLLVERPAPKPRAKKPAGPNKPRVHKAAAPVPQPQPELTGV